MRKVVSACVVIAAASVTDGIGVPASYSVNSRTGSDMIEALKAQEPHASLGEAAGDFGQLVGTWDLTCERYAADGTRTSSRGVWHFGWIVDGRMIQDVIYFFPAGQPAERVGARHLGSMTLRPSSGVSPFSLRRATPSYPSSAGERVIASSCLGPMWMDRRCAGPSTTSNQIRSTGRVKSRAMVGKPGGSNRRCT
jgi:hypothetical protein